MTWFAIRCAPQREIAVEAMLRRKGYDVFLPIEVKSKKIGKSPKKYKAVVYPMFTRYLFVAAPVPWLHLMAERHVTGVMGCDCVPSPIKDEAIEKLRNMSSAVPHIHSVNPHRALRLGELAEIQVGPFAGQIVKIEGLHGRKASIFINLFGTQKEATINLEDLEAA